MDAIKVFQTSNNEQLKEKYKKAKYKIIRMTWFAIQYLACKLDEQNIFFRFNNLLEKSKLKQIDNRLKRTPFFLIQNLYNQNFLDTYLHKKFGTVSHQVRMDNRVFWWENSISRWIYVAILFLLWTTNGIIQLHSHHIFFLDKLPNSYRNFILSWTSRQKKIQKKIHWNEKTFLTEYCECHTA